MVFWKWQRWSAPSLRQFSPSLIGWLGCSRRGCCALRRAAERGPSTYRAAFCFSKATRSFDNGVTLLGAAELHGLEGIVSKRQASAYSSGPSSDWVKVKTAAWREANRDRWRLFEKGQGALSLNPYLLPERPGALDGVVVGSAAVTGIFPNDSLTQFCKYIIAVG